MLTSEQLIATLTFASLQGFCVTSTICLLSMGNGTITATELAKKSNVSSAAMTGMIDRLEKRGLCVRVRSELDRRATYLELTELGEDMKAAILAH